MSRGMKIGLSLGVIVLVAGGVTAYRINAKKNEGTEVRMEKVGRRELVSAVTASGTTFNHTGLTNATSYNYRVRATDAVGNVATVTVSVFPL